MCDDFCGEQMYVPHLVYVNKKGAYQIVSLLIRSFAI